MPLYIPRENAGYLDGAVPTLLLVSPGPVERFPLPRLDAGTPLPCAGWRLLAGLTALVVDGPGDAGIFVEGAVHPEDVGRRCAWLDAVDRAGGAVVLVVDSHVPPEDWAAMADGGRTWGGFVPAVSGRGAGEAGDGGE
ncbi:hypothetical protein AB0K60_00405 [Thermopolyspora sp. NPDC052614]|uniref:hypothetical protein n=1 Tax=Thermopolyspora sp. NPDC052614 TaxID=3155682 RepID=UPI003444FCEE